ncbi:MAG: hypothetical protein H6705_03235 [Myxococcales bacterium]|nr:hypothetical protein [Myxococcales bacterium]
MASDWAAAAPLVVCGPMVRRVGPEGASVFVATRAACVVELRVFRPGEAAAVRWGARATVPLGPRLHVAVVTADAGAALEWGAGYGYELEFSVGGQTRGLRDDGVLVARYAEASLEEQLVYRAGDRPGFVLPAAEVGALRIVHGSCRKLHGAGHDALAHVDHLIGLAVTRDRRPGLTAAVARPQLLCLTGDQIYADDVHTSLLRRLQVYAALDLDGAEGVEIADLWPGRRAAALAGAGLTSGAMGSHLVGFAEFVAMYVFAWSPVPWGLFEKVPDDLAAAFDALPRVRRALANVSSLMVFDDHEVTDDWNIRRAWFEAVMGGGYGRRVVRNGLLAYAVFQHWGNDPAAFAAGAGAGLLAALETGWRGASGDRAAVAAVEERLGMVAEAGIWRGRGRGRWITGGATRRRARWWWGSIAGCGGGSWGGRWTWRAGRRSTRRCRRRRGGG